MLGMEIDMAVKVQPVKLVGGTRDGESWDVYSYQPMVYLAKRITLEESSALYIDGVTAWKSPEEVYEIQHDGNFHYQRTVHYKPADACSPTNVP